MKEPLSQDNQTASVWPSVASQPWAEAWTDGRLRKFWRCLIPGPALTISQKKEGTALPLIIGITGHRDISKEDALAIKKALTKLFRDLRERYPHTPLLLLSPLAEGADRLAAEAFLELNPDPPGRSLIALLPLKLENYRQTFKTADSAFDILLGQAKKCFRVPLPELTHDSLVCPTPDFDRSPYCYQAVGAYIAEQSHILIAIWDKVPDGKPGGTSRTVEARLSGRPELRSLDEDLTLFLGRGGPVIHIWASRQSHSPEPSLGGKTEAPGTVDFLTPDKKNAAEHMKLFKLGLDHLESFNREALAIGNVEVDTKLETALRPSEKKVAIMSETAAKLARRYDYKKEASLKLIVGGCTVAAFSWYFFTLINHWLFLASSLAATFFLLLVFFITAVKGWQNQHLTYRNLREQMKVILFWNLAGIRLKGARALHYEEQADDYGETRWLHQAMVYADLVLTADENTAIPDDLATLRMGKVKTDWMEYQEKYFKNSVDSKLKKHRKWSIAYLSLLISGSAAFLSRKFINVIPSAGGYFSEDALFWPLLALSMIMLVPAWGASSRIAAQINTKSRKVYKMIFIVVFMVFWGLLASQYPLSPEFSNFMAATAVLVMTLAGISFYFSHISAFNENAKRYAEHYQLFARANQLFHEAEATIADPEAADKRKRAIIEILGRRALRENSEWLRQHLKRPIDFSIV